MNPTTPDLARAHISEMRRQACAFRTGCVQRFVRGTPAAASTTSSAPPTWDRPLSPGPTRRRSRPGCRSSRTASTHTACSATATHLPPVRSRRSHKEARDEPAQHHARPGPHPRHAEGGLPLPASEGRTPAPYEVSPNQLRVVVVLATATRNCFQEEGTTRRIGSWVRNSRRSSSGSAAKGET